MKKYESENIRKRVIHELYSIAFVDGGGYAGLDIKMNDKFKAIELLGKQFGLFTEQNCSDKGVIIVDDITAR